MSMWIKVNGSKTKELINIDGAFNISYTGDEYICVLGASATHIEFKSEKLAKEAFEYISGKLLETNE